MGEYRIIILSRDGEFLLPASQHLDPDAKCIQADNGYEAAAELLAGPALALVIDLSVLTQTHQKLLHVARHVGAEVLGVGTFPSEFSADDLSGMRLIAREELPRSLQAIVARAKAEAPEATHRLAPAKENEFHPETYTSDAPRESAENNGREQY